MKCLVKAYEKASMFSIAIEIENDLRKLGGKYKISHVTACNENLKSYVQVLVVYERTESDGERNG